MPVPGATPNVLKESDPELTNSSSQNPSQIVLPTQTWQQEAENFLRVSLKHHTSDELCGPCPHCGGKDRFIVFFDGGYWCRQCNRKGFWKTNIDPEEIKKKQEYKENHRKKLLAIMQKCTDWKIYHETNPESMEYWKMEGFSEEEINIWNLGYCKACPLFSSSPSLTIPAFYRGILYDIRHRIIYPTEDGGKYRTHLEGITPPFFNLDSLYNDKTIYLVEGEKKVIKSVSCGLKTVIGYPGINYIQRLSALLEEKSSPDQRVVIIPDPGTVNRVVEKISIPSMRIFIVEIQRKPDDFVREYGTEAFLNALSIPRPL